MDNRSYNYEYRRPRFSNRTYDSNNVSNSMTFFINGPKTPKSSSYQQQFIANGSRQTEPPKSELSSLQSGSAQNSESHFDHRVSNHETIAAKSNLSTYGNNSLVFNQHQVYDKQKNQFDIVSLQPKAIPDRIKMYPKLTLEHKDPYFYKRMQQAHEQQSSLQLSRNDSVTYGSLQVAGKHSFQPQTNKDQNFYQQGRHFTPRMLNHADEVGNII